MYWGKKLGTESPPALMGDHSTIIIVAAEKLGRTPEQIRDAIDDALRDRDVRALMRDTTDFVAPARNGGPIDGEGVGRLTEDAISALPDRSQLDAVDDDEFNEPMENVEIDIRATDLNQARRE